MTDKRKGTEYNMLYYYRQDVTYLLLHFI